MVISCKCARLSGLAHQSNSSNCLVLTPHRKLGNLRPSCIQIAICCKSNLRCYHVVQLTDIDTQKKRLKDTTEDMSTFKEGFNETVDMLCCQCLVFLCEILEKTESKLADRVVSQCLRPLYNVRSPNTGV